MSLWERMLSGARTMVLVEDRIDRLEKSVDKLRDEVSNQERRLAQIEFIIYGPMHPDNLRLPR
jgi:chaperonin cofactor prefoldin